eukprot:TRINITY_DN27304_c0_g1_i1.p1 TRINITY_DN27304_c0_g1~~TRINITY_DN27304_c0_g1_i1.p1  ORF type:complete len:515 (-),score=67.19 TRINITY_DN27304_c0_g1_i1:124-1668(-)
MSATSRFKAIDFYRKIPRDLTEATLSGASLSIVAAVAMTLLFTMELRSYLSISTTSAIVVDQSPDGDLLRINFNVSFPALSCEFASVDVNDVLGTARFNLSKTVRKFPIDPNFRFVGPQHHPGKVPTPTKHGNDDDEVKGEGNPHRAALMEGGDDESNASGALVVMEKEFDSVTKEYPLLLVNFYAPWCPWSKRLEPAWEKAATILAKKYPPHLDGRIRLAKVDCTLNQPLCRRHHVQGFPSIRIFRSGHDIRESHGQHDHESYYGERDTDSLVAFAEKLVPPATIAVNGATDRREQLEGGAGAEDLHASGEVRRAPQASGCHIEGFVLVKKVPGNLMVSAHSGAHSFDASTMNLTHLVHQFSFGRPLSMRRMDQVVRLLPYVPESAARMAQHFFLSEHDNVTHDHFLQVVLSEVVPLHGLGSAGSSPKHPGLQSYDYTVHSHMLQAATVPVARFHYELSPMQVLIKEQRRSFSHFLTSVSAIVGGVFTVAGIVDSLLHNVAKVMKKVNLGKNF